MRIYKLKISRVALLYIISTISQEGSTNQLSTIFNAAGLLLEPENREQEPCTPNVELSILNRPPPCTPPIN